MVTKKFYAQRDYLGYPIPGTMQSIAPNKPVPVDTVEIPAADTITSPQNIRENKMRYFVRKDKSGKIIANSLIASLKKPSGLVYEFQPAK
ncbi:MAG: hypothetical protein ACR2IJ_04460 [Fluviibacter sp.]